MSNKQFDEWVTILQNGKINEKYFKLIFRSKPLSRNVLPGQFLHIQVQPDHGFFLRRPFSYYRIHGDRIEILYEILGKGTAHLAGRAKGDRLKVMGPLGRPFEGNVKKKKRILVAGGVGVPPLIFLAEKVRCDYLLIGCKSRGEVLPKKELAAVKANVLYATDDGSRGKKGYVTELLKDVLKNEKNSIPYIQTCGPAPMMRAVIRMAAEADIDGEASLDETMGCGAGACLGCMVKTRNGWVASCVEGPVFEFSQLSREFYEKVS